MIVGPTQRGNIDVLRGLGETYVASIGLCVVAIVEALRIDGNCGFGYRTFAEDLPRTCSDDAFLVDLHPGTEFLQDCFFLLIEGAVGTQRH